MCVCGAYCHSSKNWVGSKVDFNWNTAARTRGNILLCLQDFITEALVEIKCKIFLFYDISNYSPVKASQINMELFCGQILLQS